MPHHTHTPRASRLQPTRPISWDQKYKPYVLPIPWAVQLTVPGTLFPFPFFPTPAPTTHNQPTLLDRNPSLLPPLSLPTWLVWDNGCGSGYMRRPEHWQEGKRKGGEKGGQEERQEEPVSDREWVGWYQGACLARVLVVVGGLLFLLTLL
ncbi:hypothetical protein HOY82DRAFT_218656 [Tuber indicum]|nr:hypothetical protein HOY82DRAFT_218656 [Tuber indicum]